MIAKLTCDQIAEMWITIREGLQKDLHFPIMGKHRFRETNIQTALLSGAMEAWVSYTKTEEEQKIHLHMITLTSIHTDGCTKNKTLFIWSILGYRKPPEEIWKELRAALFKYARSKGCHTITSSTNDPDIAETAKWLGGDISFINVYFDLEKEYEFEK